MTKDLVATAPNKKSSPEQWYQWYLDLKDYFGKKIAISVWVLYWNKRAGKGSSANTNTLRDQMKIEGVTIDTNWIGSIVDGADSILDSVGGIFSFGGKIGKFLAIGLAIGVVLLVINVARKPIEALQGVAAIKGGR